MDRIGLRSSSGGSTTLSASSSPGIPADMDESQPPINLTTLSASAILGKALTGFQVRSFTEKNAHSSSVQLCYFIKPAKLTEATLGVWNGR